MKSKLLKISTTIALFLLISVSCFAQLNTSLIGTYTFHGNYNNICGYVDELGNEYAIIGNDKRGALIVDVTNPSNPILKDTATIICNALEVKVWNNFAYVATTDNGLCIINLNPLPNGHATYTYWTPTITDPSTNLPTILNYIHALHIDNNYAYLYGSNIGRGGIIIVNINNPLTPLVEGIYNTRFVHDGYVRNDTVWACKIFAGHFAAIDVSNKNNPVELAQQETPNKFPHNSWLSENSQFLFTTDETYNSYLASYDVSDVSNIKELDKIASQNPNSFSAVHNTHIIKKNSREYAVTSWYTDGVVITDVTRPQNMINTAFIDDNNLSGYGFSGTWGVYPYLPSGNIIVSDIERGLQIYSTTYTAGCYLEGKVIGANCGSGIGNVKIEINSLNLLDSTSSNGSINVGTHLSGTYSVTFSKIGFLSQTINNVVLQSGLVTTLNIIMQSPTAVAAEFTIKDKFGNAIKDANISLISANNEYLLNSNIDGKAGKCDIISDVYDISISKWGYEIICYKDTFLTNNNLNKFNVSLKKQYQDDFNLNFGWQTFNNSTYHSKWERVIPKEYIHNGQMANPNIDSDNDCGNKAFITGNTSFVGYNQDVDSSEIRITSPPLYNIYSFGEATLSYSKWFFASDTSDISGQNYIVELVIKNGANSNTIQFDNYDIKKYKMSEWIDTTINIENFIDEKDTLYLVVRVSDTGPDNEVEGGFDNFKLFDNNPELATTSIKNTNKNSVLIYPNPSAQNFTLQAVEKIQVQIVDVQGRVKEEFTIQANEQKTFGNNYAKGIYFVKTISANNSNTQKIVKQ